MESNNNLNSCMMLAMSFHTAIDLDSVILEQDLTDYGIEFDSHVTIFYAKEKVIPQDNLLSDVEILLGDEDYEVFMELLKSERKFPILDIFDLSKFNGATSDYLVMKMKPGNEIYRILNILNKGLSRKYDIVSDFDSYRPHMTLAELQPGTSEKYLNSEKLELVLKSAKVGFEDLIISYGSYSDKNDREQRSITNFHTLERYFRNERYKRSN